MAGFKVVWLRGMPFEINVHPRIAIVARAQFMEPSASHCCKLLAFPANGIAPFPVFSY